MIASRLRENWCSFHRSIRRALVPGFDHAATVVIGPGEAAQCHQTDEFCYVHQIDEAFHIYTALMPAYVRVTFENDALDGQLCSAATPSWQALQPTRLNQHHSWLAVILAFARA